MMRIFSWGAHRNCGIWWGPVRQRRLMLGGGDRIIYLAIGHLALRICKPHRFQRCCR
jgi:hypothetical protein